MKTCPALLLACMAFSCITSDTRAESILERTERDEIVVVPDDSAAMAAAFRKARASLDAFLKLLDAPPPGTHSYAIKLRVDDRSHNEYFWIGSLRREGKRFRGTLDNIPRLVKNVRAGQVMRFGQDDILDWTYIDATRGRTMGNFTACALLTQETPESAAAFKERYGLVCD